MGDIEITREWLAKADENFEFAVVTHFTKQEAVKAKDAADSVRQAVTKTLSSFLQSRQEQPQ